MDSDKGLVSLLICKRQLRDACLQHAQKEFNGWQPETVVKMHSVFSSIPVFRDQMHIDNLSWQRGWKPSELKFVEVMESILASDKHDKALRTQK